MTSVATAFSAVQASNNSKKRAALVGYLPAGFPDKQTAVDAALAMVHNGADILEIGLPYSDPLMDGPVIADAVYRSLAGGTRVGDVFDTVQAITSATRVPVLVMTYWNPVDHYGVDRFAKDLKRAGGAGLITPDLTPEEAGDWLAVSDAHDLDRVFLVAPSSTPERIGYVTRHCRGFVYAASLMGITGARASVSEHARGLVERTRRHTSLPVAVGLGVSTGAQAAEVAEYADGVIVGSAFVRRLHPAAPGTSAPGGRPALSDPAGSRGSAGRAGSAVPGGLAAEDAGIAAVAALATELAAACHPA